MIELILFGSFLVLLALGVPVAFSLGLAAVATIVYASGADQLSVVPSVVFASLSSETLLAIPFFILAGAIMEYAGISARLIDFADAVVGKFKHGLAMVVVISAFFFSAISGSGPATVAAIGSILIPALIRRGYARRHAASMVAAAGSMGIVVPPSIAFIIFAVVVSEYQRVSIGRLFIAGIVPGILMAIALIVAAFFLPRVMPQVAARTAQPALAGARGGTGTSDTPATADTDGLGAGAYTAPEAEPFSEAEAEVAEHVGDGTARQHWASAFLRAIPGLLVPIIILGGIYGGIFTPTESAVVASVYALIVGLFIYREIKITRLPRVFTVAAVQSAVVMLIVGCASVFAYVITRQQVAQTVSDALLGITENKYLILLIVMVLLLIVGMFIDAVSALYLFVPLLAPVLLHVGVDVTTMGVLMVVNLAVGMITPPVGVNLFVAAGIARAPLSEVVKGIMPFLSAVLIVLTLVTFIPALSNWLPDLLGV
ncbi:TRAP transporter large permease [Ornithinimicrobium cavernae]|uniref:TRAP transporter large permease n=1 Tax=Ornithinimicrobium cavernae TaxID=2666047 RepID=UPI000D69EA06|nr:TRAP transporter large permease [Ornithinimicrobium cavernae]